MKKLFIAVLASSFIFVVGAIAADESNLPDSQRTDQFTIHQQLDEDLSVKALIGADRIPVVDNADLENPQFVGTRQGVDVSKQIQKQTPTDIQSPSVTGVTPSAPMDPTQP